MIIFLNNQACSMLARQKWQAMLQSEHMSLFQQAMIREDLPTQQLIRDLFQQGQRVFIAAGGDGTVNYLMNILMTSLTVDELRVTYFGAIGLGSSNDFHKPMQKSCLIAVDLNNARYRDVLKIEYTTSGGEEGIRYALLNSSIGFCAQANDHFNTQSVFKSLLKKINVDLAILYSICCTVFKYQFIKNLLIEITQKEQQETHLIADLANLHIVKSNHVAGGLHYEDGGVLGDSEYALYVASASNRIQLLASLWRLSQGAFNQVNRHKSIPLKEGSINMKCSSSFLMELDGELIRVKSALVSLVSQAIQCCGPVSVV